MQTHNLAPNTFRKEQHEDPTTGATTNSNNQTSQNDAPIKGLIPPVHVFPEKLAKLVNELSIKYKFPADFSITALLYCFSVAIGNNFKVRMKAKWIECVILWLCIIAPPGATKSPVLSFWVEPFREQDEKEHANFIDEFAKHEAKKKAATKDEPFNEPEPHWKQILVSDFTIEALTKVLQDNPTRTGICVDELSGFFAEQKRYSSAGHTQKYLSLYGGLPLPINRKGALPIYIKNPFVSIFGGMQPKIAASTFTPELLSNGTFDRFLYSCPANLKKEIPGNEELSERLYEDYAHMITYLLKISNTEPVCIEIAADAKKELHNFRQGVADAVNEANKKGNERLAGMLNKFDYHVIRLSLIMQVMQDAVTKQQPKEIGIKAVSAAIELCKYFMHHAGRVLSIIEANPAAGLPEDKQQLFEGLPDGEFTLSDAILVAKTIRGDLQPDGLSMWVRRFLSSELFKYVSRGIYKKTEVNN